MQQALRHADELHESEVVYYVEYDEEENTLEYVPLSADVKRVTVELTGPESATVVGYDGLDMCPGNVHNHVLHDLSERDYELN